MAIKRKPTQADIQEGERLLRELATEISPEPISEEEKPSREEAIDERRQENHQWFGREVFGVLGWTGNGGYMLDRWQLKKQASTVRICVVR